MNVENPRLRLLLGNQWRLIVGVLVVVAVASFAGTGLAYTDRDTTTETVEVNQQQVETTTGHRAVVVDNRSLWPPNTTLENQPVYLVNATPTVEAVGRTSVSGTDRARITHVWRLRITVASGDETFYAETVRTKQTTRTNATVTSTFEIDVRAVQRRIAAIQETVGGAGTVDATLELAVQYRTDPGSDSGYAGNETFSTPLDVGSNSYTIGEDMGGVQSHSRSESRTVTQPRDWGQLAGMMLVGVVAMALAGAVVTTDPDEIDVDQARIDLHSTQYEQWISPGVIPMGISQQFIELESIEDVVDVAIDTNERVVYDRRRDLYAVISENVVYYYSTGGSWMESAFRRMDVPGDGGGGDMGAAFDPDVFGGAGDADFGFADEAEMDGSPFSDGGGEASFGDDEESPFDGDEETPFGGADGSGGSDDGDGGGADADGDGPFDGADEDSPFDDADEDSPFDGDDGG